jgi:hypothetical protein
MKLFSSRLLPWFNLSAGVLVVLLQRTPALRTLVQAKDYVLRAGPGEMLRAAFAAVGLGAMHSLAGATTYVQSPANPITGTVGTPLSGAFSYTGAPSDAQNWTILGGSLPPGVSFVPAPISGTIRARDVGLTGTPTQAGNFTVTVRANGVGGQSNPVDIIFQITGGANVAPSISSQPQTQTVAVGANVSFTVQAAGTPTPQFQWRRDGNNVGGATNATLNLTNVQLTDAGVYSVVVSNSAGSVTSANATLTVNAPGGAAPVITAQPLGFTAATGSTAALTVAATGTANTYTWRRGTTVVQTSAEPTLILPAVSAAVAGSYTVTVQNAGGSVQSSSVNVAVGGGEGRLANLSVRANLAASQTLIVGFSTNGGKSVLIRGIGPTLSTAPFNIGGAYADPRLELYSGSTMLTQNNDWNAALAAAFTSVGAFPLVNGSRDAALQSTLSGSHSAHLTGPNSGVVLVELYDSGAGMNPRLVNVSARNFVGVSDDIMIAGFVVDGAVAKTLLIRAVGPTLQSTFGLSGTLTDPKLEIYRGETKLTENDNWTASLADTARAVGAFALVNGSRDAALLVTLPPGSYTAQVSGIASGTGEALVEVYEVP